MTLLIAVRGVGGARDEPAGHAGGPRPRVRRHHAPRARHVARARHLLAQRGAGRGGQQQVRLLHPLFFLDIYFCSRYYLCRYADICNIYKYLHTGTCPTTYWLWRGGPGAWSW